MSAIKRFFPTSHKNEPEFVVLIPVYNGSKYITQAIVSVLEQEGVILHIIISDNNSKDDSCEKILASLEQNNNHYIDFIKRQDTLPMIDHWNYLIEIAQNRKEEFFSILHADDMLIGKDVILKGIQALRDQPSVNLVLSGLVFLDIDGVILGKRSRNKTGLLNILTTTRESIILSSNRFGIPIAIRSSSIVPFSSRYQYAMDIDFLIRVNGSSDWVYYIQDCMVGYRTHVESVTYFVQRHAFKDFVQINHAYEIGLSRLDIIMCRFFSIINPSLRRIWIFTSRVVKF